MCFYIYKQNEIIKPNKYDVVSLTVHIALLTFHLDKKSGSLLTVVIL